MAMFLKFLEVNLFLYYFLYLNVPLEIAGDKRPKTPPERQSVEVWEDNCSVQYNSMDDVQRPQIIFKSMADQDGVGVDEPHQIILYFLKILGLASH